MQNALRTTLDWIAEAHQRHAMRELRRLDHHTLRDIGLSPDEIDYIACRDSVSAGTRGRRHDIIVKSSLGIMGGTWIGTPAHRRPG
jgi:uncharacterized protein YjiS (DUF1127 family)